MKSSIVKMAAVLLLISLGWSCQKESSDNSLSSTELKSAITSNVSTVSSAVASLKSTDAYKVVSLSDATLKDVSADGDTSNIVLADIAGIYDYKPTQVTDVWGFPFLKFFQKTDSSDLCIVRLPQSKMAHPRTLFYISPADTNLVNDYIITVSDYQFQNILATSNLYRLAAGINIAGTEAGSLKIDANATTSAYSYTSSFDFGNGMVAAITKTSGDTAVQTQTITKDGVVLFEEKVFHIKSAATQSENGGGGRMHRGGKMEGGDALGMGFRTSRERNYILTIGNITLKRLNGAKVPEIYVDGVLQANATVTIADKEDDSEGPSVCRSREITITFEDGTSTTVSQLASDVLGDVETIFTSLRSAYFASNIVDAIAGKIVIAKHRLH